MSVDAPAERPTTELPDPRDRGGTKRHWRIDVSLVVAATVFVTVVSEAFTVLHTPDSEFYATLATFGDQITDRAAFPTYFWTKLGVIAPKYVLSHYFGYEVAHQIFRVVLILVVVASGYAAAARDPGRRLLGIAGGLFLGLNSVFLTFAGDPYFTGAGIAALAVVTAATALQPTLRHPWNFSAAWISGMAMGWAAMLHPIALVYAVVTAGALTLWQLVDSGREGFRAGFGQIGFSLLGAWTSFSLLLFAGTIIFPGNNYVETILQFTKGIDPGDYGDAGWSWLATETSLLVPVTAMAIVVALWLAGGRHRESVPGALVAGSGLIFIVAVTLMKPGPWVQGGGWSALLWPMALLGILLSLAARNHAADEKKDVWVLAAGAMVWTALGHSTISIGMLYALSICLGLIAVTVLLILVTKRPRIPIWRLVTTIVVVGAGFQLVQNGRPAPSDVGVPRLPYSSAFVDNNTELKLRSSLAIQPWVLVNTTDSDRVMVWTDRSEGDDPRVSDPLISAAAMSLWGPNSISTGNDIGEWEMANLRNGLPSQVVIYATAKKRADQMWRELSRVLTVAKPRCEEFVAPTDVPPDAAQKPTIFVCLVSVSPKE